MLCGKVTRYLLLLQFLIWNYIKWSVADETNCYATDNDPYIQYSTKTAYEYVRAKKVQPIPHCKPVMMWAALRHGTRYPGIQTIENMRKLTDIRSLILENHEKENSGQLCEKDRQLVKSWMYRLSPNYENKLSTQGKDDIRFIARRLKSQFKDVLDVPYTSNKFLFYNDGTERTVESTEAFIEGLFSSDVAKSYRNSSLLKESNACAAWVKNVENNPDTNREYKLFEESIYVQKLIADVSSRLGFRYNLTFETIFLLYDSCRYEKAWYIESRPAFCSAFSKEELKVLEYLEDLKYYYHFSYGNDMNKNLACPLISDMVQRFNDIALGNNKSTIKPLGVFYFTHTSTLLPLITLLKLKEDNEHLLHNNYASMSKREFMTSIVNPFSANLVAAFYKCNIGEENRVILYLNEEVVRYPGCDVGLCSWNSFYEKVKPIVETQSCNFNFCNSGVSTIIVLSSKWLWSISIFVTLIQFSKFV